MSTWREEAVGIEPWGRAAKAIGDKFIEFEYQGSNIVTGEPYTQRIERVVYVPNLEDPDTLAAFDRRLALRLGAPEDAVREGVLFGRVPDVAAGDEPPEDDDHPNDEDDVEDDDPPTWHILAGLSRGGRYPEQRGPVWSKDLGMANVVCPITARVRAWKSVPDKKPENRPTLVVQEWHIEAKDVWIPPWVVPDPNPDEDPTP